MTAFWLGFTCGAIIGSFGLIVAASVYILCRRTPTASREEE